MDNLFLIIGVLLVAVIGRALVHPWPSAGREGAERERDQLMESIARSFF